MQDHGIRTLCTLGPSSLNPATIEKLTSRGVGCFRINMSHASIPELREFIELIRRHSDTPICIDTEGAQVRTRKMARDTDYRLGTRVQIVTEDVLGDESTMPLRPAAAVSQLKAGSIVAVDFDSLLLRVTEVHKDGASAVVINRGVVKSNRAITIFPTGHLPPLSERDHEAVKVGAEYGVTEYALSFANSADDVLALRRLVGDDSTIVSKIESQNGVNNLDEIFEVTDAILIDRGDLSREVPLENIPFLQKLIIRKARAANCPVYVATNLLESMLVQRKPTRAELNDVINSLIDGANGLVLAAETAIGDYPVPAVDMLLTLIERFRASLEGYRIEDLLEPSSSLLPSLHGTSNGHARTAIISPQTAKIVDKLPVIDMDMDSAMDVDQIVNGVYSPLQGFMDSSELKTVLENYRLPSGAVWTLPIVFQVSSKVADTVAPGRTVALRDPRSGDTRAVLHVSECYTPDMAEVARKWFETDSPDHPGVAKFMGRGEVFLGGHVEIVDEIGFDRSALALTPAQSRMIFSVKGWTKVVAFHTRNVPHCGHEFLMREALNRTNADGLFIHPVIGPKKEGDFDAEAVLGAYDVLVEEVFPGALLGAFSTYSRYSGPREGVFTALCRKNFGCTHFIVGRDHTGVGSFYAPDATQQLFESLGDIGIEAVCFDKVYYCPKCKEVVGACEHGEENAEKISGTRVRTALEQGQKVPSWLMRESVFSFLQQRMENGQPVFV